MVERIYDMMAVVLLFAVNLIWFTPPANARSFVRRVRIAGFGLLVAHSRHRFSDLVSEENRHVVIGWFERLFDALALYSAATDEARHAHS